MNTDVVTSANPTGGAAAWTVTSIGTDDATGISCALASESSKLCVAVDCVPKAWFSTNPLGGAGTWAGTPLSESPLCGLGLNAPTGISCPSVSTCVAINQAGNVIASSEPTGERSKWVYADVDGEVTLNSISCPTTSLCVAVDNKGSVVTSTSPLAGAGAWHLAKIDGTTVLRSVSCASETLCVVGDEAGNVLTSTDPTGGEGAWTAAHVDGSAGVLGMSCPSVSLCVGVDNQAGAVVSTNPTGGVSAWAREIVDKGQLPTAVSCTSSALCVVTDWHGNVVTGTGSGFTPPPPPPPPTSEETSKGKPGTPESHVIAPVSQILSTESNGEGTVTILLACPPGGSECGPLNVQLTTELKVQGNKIVGVLARKKAKTHVKKVVIGSVTVSLAAGQHRKVAIKLNKLGRSLLAKYKHLKTRLQVLSHGKPVATRTVKLTKRAVKKGR